MSNTGGFAFGSRLNSTRKLDSRTAQEKENGTTAVKRRRVENANSYGTPVSSRHALAAVNQSNQNVPVITQVAKAEISFTAESETGSTMEQDPNPFKKRYDTGEHMQLLQEKLGVRMPVQAVADKQKSYIQRIKAMFKEGVLSYEHLTKTIAERDKRVENLEADLARQAIQMVDVELAAENVQKKLQECQQELVAADQRKEAEKEALQADIKELEGRLKSLAKEKEVLDAENKKLLGETRIAENKMWEALQLAEDMKRKMESKDEQLQHALDNHRLYIDLREEDRAKSEKVMKETVERHAKEMESLVTRMNEEKEKLVEANGRLEQQHQETCKLLADRDRLLADRDRDLMETKMQLHTSMTETAFTKQIADAAKADVERMHQAQAEMSLELVGVKAKLDSVESAKAKLDEEVQLYRERTGKAASEVEVISAEKSELEDKSKNLHELIFALQTTVNEYKMKQEVMSTLLEARTREADGLRESWNAEKDTSNALKERVKELEGVRKKLHNQIQELKGNIRVFCRVRPLMGSEEGCDEQGIALVQYPSLGDLAGRAIEVRPPSGQKQQFTFDKVIPPGTSQAEVFEEISMLVQSALDGYKVCVFAYGQTGSGKTFTMLGQPGDSELKGMIPRAIEQIFMSSEEMLEHGWQFTMEASLLEIYNETVRDLLTGLRGMKVTSQEIPSTTANKPLPFSNKSKASVSSEAASANSAKTIKPAQFSIYHDDQGNTFVSELTLVEIQSWEAASRLLSYAADKRSVGKTDMNEQSSRSHCIFTMRIKGENKSNGLQTSGVLNLVDLAGSERLNRSNAQGAAMKEAQAINKSLSNLNDVFTALATKEKHVPYRNSKLTYLLQPSLGGDAKSLMFVNMAPDVASCPETISSLRFASKVNQCEVGVARRNTSVSLT